MRPNCDPIYHPLSWACWNGMREPEGPRTPQHPLCRPVPMSDMWPSLFRFSPLGSALPSLSHSFTQLILVDHQLLAKQAPSRLQMTQTWFSPHKTDIQQGRWMMDKQAGPFLRA